jgi:hypothetical protein
MPVASEVDPGVLLKTTEQGFRIGLIPDQDINETSETLDATKLLPDLREMIVGLTHRQQLGSNLPVYYIRPSSD